MVFLKLSDGTLVTGMSEAGAAEVLGGVSGIAALEGRVTIGESERAALEGRVTTGERARGA